MNEAFDRFLDDPVRTSGAITLGTLAVFGIVREMVPPQHKILVETLAVADFVYNSASWRAIKHNHRRSQDASHSTTTDDSVLENC